MFHTMKCLTVFLLIGNNGLFWTALLHICFFIPIFATCKLIIGSDLHTCTYIWKERRTHHTYHYIFLKHQRLFLQKTYLRSGFMVSSFIILLKTVRSCDGKKHFSIVLFCLLYMYTLFLLLYEPMFSIQVLIV